MKETQRFKFKAPTEEEIQWIEKFRFLRLIESLAFIILISILVVVSQNKLFTLFVCVLAIALLWPCKKLADIEKRVNRNRFGFVGLTPTEIRISKSASSLCSIRWHDFRGFEIKKGCLIFFYYDARIIPDRSQSEPLDRLHLNDLEDAETLVVELQEHIVATKN